MATVQPPDLGTTTTVTEVVTTEPAEPGVSTTEFAGKTAIQLITGILAALTAFGHNLSVEQQVAILSLAGTVIAALEFGYSISRGIRKRGTPG